MKDKCWNELCKDGGTHIHFERGVGGDRQRQISVDHFVLLSDTNPVSVPGRTKKFLNSSSSWTADQNQMTRFKCAASSSFFYLTLNAHIYLYIFLF